MSLLDFRNAFLSKVQSRLNSIDVTNASDSELLISGALFKQLDAVNRIDPIAIDALKIIENMNGAELDAYALDPSSRVHVQNIIKDIAILSAIAQSPATMNAIASSQEWVKLIAAESNAITICTTSATAMNSLASNVNARSIIGTSGALFTAIKASSMSYAKLIAGYAGLIPSAYSDLTSLFTVAADVNTITANATIRSIIGNTGLAFDAAKVNSMTIAKLIAGYAGLNPATYADMTALAANVPAMTTIASNVDAINILSLSNTALTSVFASYTNRTLLWNSAVAIGILIGTSTSQNFLLGNATSVNFFPGNSSTVSTKKAWMLRMYSTYPSTSGNTYYKYNSGGGSNNMANTLLPGYTSGSPYLVPSNLAKVAFPEIYSTYSGSAPDGAYYTYIQMEA